MDLTGYKIYDVYGDKTIELEGNYCIESLSEKFIEEWVPYINCGRKCPRVEHCTFIKPNPNFPDVTLEIYCGVGVNSIKNFVKSTFHILEASSADKIQAYLDGAFFFSQFILHAESTIGTCISEFVLDDYGDYVPEMYGRITGLREDLNKLATALKNIPEFASTKGVLFVEGWTEEAFLSKLRESHEISLDNLIIEVYSGTGNRRPTRIQMLLESFIKRGYAIYIEGDADGKDSDIFQKLVETGAVTKEHTFIFKYDFESSVPFGIFFEVVQELGELSDINYDEFLERIHPLDKSIIAKIQDIFGVDLKPLKMDIATTTARIINDANLIWEDYDEFMKTELGRFIHFVRNIS